MGFSNCNYDAKKVAEYLNINTETALEALKYGRMGGLVRVWEVEDKGKFSVVRISSSKKRKEDGGYDVDFQDKFVRLVGHAHEKMKQINVTEKGVTIRIINSEVTNKYVKEKNQVYTNCVIFDFEEPFSNKEKPAQQPKPEVHNVPQDDTDDLPFC